MAVIGAKQAFTYKDRLLYLPAIVAMVNEAVWHAFPILVLYILRLGATGQIETDMAQTAIGSVLDLTYIIFWLLGFFFMAKKGEARFAKSNFGQYLYTDTQPVMPFEGIDRQYFLTRLRYFLLVCLTMIILYYPLSRIFNWPTSYATGFLTIQDTHGSVRFIMLYSLFKRTLQIAVPLSCVYLMLKGEKLISISNILPLSVILLTCFSFLASGARGFVMTPLVLLVLTAYCLNQRLRYYVAAALLLFIFLIVMSPALRAVRATEEFAVKESRLERIKLIFEFYGVEKRPVIAETAERLNNAWVTGLVYNYTPVTTGFVGIKPYIAVPFTLLPRAIWQGKPLIGSYDGTYDGVLPYLAAHWIYGTGADVTLTPGVGSQPYWAGGWTGVVLIGFLGGLIVGFLWAYLRLSHSPVWLIALLATLGRGVSLNAIYYDVSWFFQYGLQDAVLIFAYWFLTIAFARKSTYEVNCNFVL
ncbi:MAG: hypothetical protein WDA68_01330 [Phycisphaerae bacterium]